MTEPAPTSPVLCSPWATPGDVPDATKAKLGLEDDGAWTKPLMFASEVLWMLSGRQWSGQGCEETAVLRSVAATPGRGDWPYNRTWGSCSCWLTGSWMDGYLWPSSVFLGVHIMSPVAVRLPRNKISAVTSVTINGEPFADWELERTGWLRRTDGLGWGVCDDSTSVTYQFGAAPPMGAVTAVVQMAIEFAKALNDIKGCKLPDRVTTVSREGVTMTVIDPQTFLNQGRTGLYLVDLWLGAVNPQSRPQQASIWSPDLPVTTIAP
jgi:hypothetical protein